MATAKGIRAPAVLADSRGMLSADEGSLAKHQPCEGAADQKRNSGSRGSFSSQGQAVPAVEADLRAALDMQRASDTGINRLSLRKALESAEAHRADASLINQGHLALAEAGRRSAAAMTKLRNAMCSRDVAALYEALGDAQAAEVDDELINEARLVAEREQHRTAVEGCLREAMRGDDAAALAKALEEAKSAGVSAHRVDRAAAILTRLGDRERAKRRLEDALARFLSKQHKRDEHKDSAQELHEALLCATEAGCEASLLNAVHRELAAGERRAWARKSLESALRNGDRGMLHAAVWGAQAAGVEKTLIAHALETLQEGDRFDEVHSSLQEAVSSREAMALEEAVAKAEAAGMGEEALCHAAKVLVAELHGPAQQASRVQQASRGATENTNADLEEKSESNNCGLKGACIDATIASIDEKVEAAQCTQQPDEEAKHEEVEEEEEEEEEMLENDVVMGSRTDLALAICRAVPRSATGALEDHRPACKTPTSTASCRSKCVMCGEPLSSVEDAEAHLRSKHGAKPATAADWHAPSSPEASQAQPAVSETPVACDGQGRPIVLRRLDGKTGSAQTVVVEEDGTENVFGAKTVQSMAECEDKKLGMWLAMMSDRKLRGLVHEVTQRVVEGSQRYHKKREQLQKLSQSCHFAFFGLDADASERDLDAAYRRMAKALHPDKHGGSEQAKERFQAMKAKYDSLKKTMAARKGECNPEARTEPDTTKKHEQGEAGDRQSQEPKRDDEADKKKGMPTDGEGESTASSNEKEGGDRSSSESSGGSPSQSSDISDAGEEEHEGDDVGEAKEVSEGGKQDRHRQREPRRQEAYEEDEPRSSKAQDKAEKQRQQAEHMQCDFDSRDSVLQMVWKMLRQIQNINTQEASLDAELQHLQRVA